MESSTSTALCGGEARQASIVAAENVAGVKEVHDHLRVFETFTGTYVEGAPIERRGI